MMAPQPRLILLTLAAGIPLGLLAALQPGLMPAAAGIAALLALAAMADAVLSGKALRRLHVALPEVVRMTKEKAGSFDVEITPAGGIPPGFRIGIAFPPEIVSPDEVRQVALAGTEPQRIPWPCMGVKRGLYRLDAIHAEAASALGFWALRRRLPVQCEFRIYPDILRERTRMAGLFMNRGLTGIHSRRMVGKGRELERLREYSQGDLYEDIYWKTTAKRGKPITRVYQVERTQEVYVAVDMSRLSARPLAAEPREDAPEWARAHIAKHATCLERYLASAMLLGLVAERQGDLFGVLAFDTQVRRFIRARNGRAHFNACRDALYNLEPGAVNPGFDEFFSFVRTYLRRRSLLVVLTNLDDPLLAENFARNLDVIARHHLVLVNLMRQPGAHPLFSDGAVDKLDDIYDKLGGHIQWRQNRELACVLRRRGVDVALLDNEMMTTQLVSQYMNVKQRQIL